MTGHSENEYEYDDGFVAGLEWVWGEGFLSPGGPGEIAAVVEGLDLSGKRILDIGCGLGGADVVLVRDLQAGHVVGIDIEKPLITRARQIVAGAGLQCLLFANPHGYHWSRDWLQPKSALRK